MWGRGEATISCYVLMQSPQGCVDLHPKRFRRLCPIRSTAALLVVRASSAQLSWLLGFGRLLCGAESCGASPCRDLTQMIHFVRGHDEGDHCAHRRKICPGLLVGMFRVED